MAYLHPASCAVTTVGNATIVLSNSMLTDLQVIRDFRDENGSFTALQFNFTADQPPVYLTVGEFNSSRFPGGIDGLAVLYNDRANTNITGTWLHMADLTKYSIFGAGLSGDTVWLFSKNISRFYVVDGDLSMIVRWINPVMFAVLASNGDPATLRDADQAITITTPKDAAMARLQELAGI